MSCLLHKLASRVPVCSKHAKNTEVYQLFRRWTATGRQIPRLQKAVTRGNKYGDSGYILLVIPITAFCLGTWQVRRREWKLKLIDQLEQRTNADPIEIPDDWTALHAEDMNFRQVKVTGEFDHAGELYIGPRSNVQKDSSSSLMSRVNPSGVNVITPFKVKDRDLILLVNRGWVPQVNIHPKTRPLGQVEGEVSIVGTIRHTEKRPAFAPKNTPSTGVWMQRDVDWMSEWAGTDPLFIDADRDSTHQHGPIGGQTRVSLRNEHVSYIITWYSLAGITMWMWYKRYRRPPPPDTMERFRKRMAK